MASKDFTLTQDYIKEILHYCPDTGIFTRVFSKRTNLIGKAAGCTHKLTGYIGIKIYQRTYQAHNLAWLYVHGEWPDKDIDHINRIKTDNRICNLRLATRSENCINKSISNKNTSGFKGVHWNSRDKVWVSRATLNGKRVNLGCYKTAIEASNEYEKFALDNYGEFYTAEGAELGLNIPEPMHGRESL